MRKSLALAPVAGALLAFSTLAGTARADTLILKEKDGTSARIEGKLIERREHEFVFEHTIGGARIRSTFARADVVSVLVDVVDAPVPGTRTREAPPAPASEPEHRGERAAAGGIPEELPELDPAHVHNVVIALDRSKAMLVGDRWKSALDVVDSIVEHLPPKATFGVYIFDEAAYNVLGSNFVSKTELKRQRLRPTLETLGVNPWDRGNIRAGLVAAFHSRPDAVYLVSPGVAAQNPEETAAFVKLMASLHPKSKKFPVHVVSVLGGQKGEEADDGTDTRRQVLETLAKGLDGTYREVLLAAVATGQVPHRRGGKPPKATKKTFGAGGGHSGLDAKHLDPSTLAAIRQRQQQGQNMQGTTVITGQ